MVDRARRELTALRLAAQGIARTAFDSPADVVRFMLGMQAQDYPGVKLSIGLRTRGATERSVEAALADGSIARSWPFRGTLHVVAPEDLGWMLPLAAERQATASAKRRADLGITDADLAVAEDVAREQLRSGGSIRRDALLVAWNAAGVATDGQRAYHLLWNLGHRGVLVFGATDGKQPTFALLEHRVPAPKLLERDEALGELARRYFRSHGPATVRDLAWWASITLSDARRGVELSGDALQRRQFDGVEHLLAPELEPAPLGVHLLPGFDEYLLGYTNRDPVLPRAFADRIVPGNNGVFQPTIVDDGQVVGTWRRVETAKQVSVTPVPFQTLTTRAERGIASAARRIGRYAGKPATVVG